MSRRRKPTTTTTPGRMGRMAGWPLRPPGRVIAAVTRRGRTDARTDASGWWNARLAVRAMSLAIVVALAVALSPSSAPVQAADPPPGTPASVSVTRSNGALTASWDAVKYATSYHITYSSDGGGSWSLAALNHAGTSISIGVSNSETYLVGVRARNDAGDGGWRNSPSVGPFVLTPPPATPASVSVTRADGALTASWGAVKGATSYHVTYSSDGGGSWSLAASNHAGTSITISGADNSKSYLVGVRARNEGGDSGWRNSPTIAPYTPGRSLTFGSHTVSDQSWTQDTAIDTLRLPAATSACEGVCTTVEPRVTYTLSPSLPSGVSFDASARTVSGTPTAVAASATYTYTAAADGHTAASLTFSIAVAAPGLSFGGATVADQSWTVNTAIDTLTLPAAVGSTATVTYALSAALPAGLSFDASARTVTGTPTETADSATYNYTATDGTDTVALSFAIEVLEEQGASAQAGLSWVTAPPTLLEWTQGVAVNVTLPAATGDPNITYKLTQGCGSKGAQLPPGISWNAGTRTLSGTPTKWSATRAACYQAYASNKSAPSVTIHIRAADTSGNHAPYASIKSSGSQLLGQLWTKYGDCYSGSVTFAPSSGHSKHFYDPEDDTLTYTAGSNKLVGTTINSSGYAVATLRHPPVNWYSFHYTATDPDGLYDSIALEVKHFDCKHTLSVQENKPKDTVVGSVGGPNKADGSSFSLGGDAATYFDIDSSTGQVTVKDGTTLDYETTTSYSGTFRYTVENTSVGGNIQINVNDVRAPNVDRPTLAQNSTNPTTALDVSWTAPTPMTGTTINDYDVRYREWTTSTWTEMPDTTNSTATSTTITGLTAGKEYEVQVRAQIADEGPGHWSHSSVILYLAENTAVNGNVGGKFNVNATDYYPLQLHPRRDGRLQVQAQYGHRLQDGPVGPDAGEDGQRPGLREQVQLQPHPARRREQPAAEHPRRHLQRPRHRDGRERAAGQADGAHGGGQLDHAHDQAGRVVDGPDQHRQAGDQRLRRAIPADGRLYVEQPQLHRHGYQSTTLSGPDRGQEVRRAGARRQRRGQRRLVGHGQRHHHLDRGDPQRGGEHGGQRQRGRGGDDDAGQLHPGPQPGRNGQGQVRDRRHHGADHRQERHEPGLRERDHVVQRGGEDRGHGHGQLE